MSYLRVVSDKSMPIEITDKEWQDLPEKQKYCYRQRTIYDDEPIKDEPVSREMEFARNDAAFFEIDDQAGYVLQQVFPKGLNYFEPGPADGAKENMEKSRKTKSKEGFRKHRSMYPLTPAEALKQDQRKASKRRP